MLNSIQLSARRLFVWSVLVTCCSGGALANNNEPGSLLIFPEYDARPGALSFITVTNVNSSTPVKLQFRFSEASSAGTIHEWSEVLTPLDTITLLASAVVPTPSRGFCTAHAVAVGSPTETAIDFDYLVGSQEIFQGLATTEYRLNAFAFQGLSGEGNRIANTDTVLNLDGIDYSAAPEITIVPQFFGQGPAASMPQTELILLSLTPPGYATTVDFLIHNDNEEIYSAEHTFNRWERVAFIDISGLFSNSFLRNNTNHDADEIRGFKRLESGWFTCRGSVASSPLLDLSNPAILAAVIETGHMTAASPPFSTGRNLNGTINLTGIIYN